MKGVLVWLALLGLALSSGGISHAQSAAAARENALYGPAMLCMGNYAVHLGADEGAELGIQANGHPTFIIIHRPGQPEIFVNFAMEQNEKARRHPIRASDLGEVIRVDTPRTSGYRAGIPGEAVYFVDEKHRAYLLPGADGERAIEVSSQAFYGKGSDVDELAHFSKRQSETACDDLVPLWAAPRNTAPTILSARKISAPATICLDGLALQLAEGEVAQRGWDRNGNWRISGPSSQYDVLSLIPYRRGNTVGRLATLGFTKATEQPGYVSLAPPPSFPRKAGDSYFVSVSYRSGTAAAALALLNRMQVRRWRDQSCVGGSDK